jgi:hypothetical protein
MTYFGMVTTSRSKEYTLPALDSFFRYTELSTRDRFFLIDNDGTFSLPSSSLRVELLTPDKPQGFAANANTLLGNAIDAATDLIFLNNDIIFSPGWNIPLCSTDASILIPLCNQNLQYQYGNLTLQFLMDLADFLGREQHFLKIVEKHVADTSWRGFRKELHMSFFCFRLPYQISSVVGFFDEQFGRGGGEMSIIASGHSWPVSMCSSLPSLLCCISWASRLGVEENHK